MEAVVYVLFSMYLSIVLTNMDIKLLQNHSVEMLLEAKLYLQIFQQCFLLLACYMHICEA